MKIMWWVGEGGVGGGGGGGGGGTVHILAVTKYSQ